MYTQTKSFEIRLLEDLFESNNLINIHSDKCNTNVVEKFENGIEQVLIYGIETENIITLFENDVVKKLLDLRKLYIDTKTSLTYRRLGAYRIRICLLDYKSTKEEKRLFIKLTVNK